MGQMLLTAAAAALGTLLVWVVGMVFMVGNGPVELASWLVILSLRTWVFSIPFLGIGMAASQWTTSGAWARVLAIGATAASWVIYAFGVWFSTDWTGPVAIAGDATLQILPQGWLSNLWEPGGGWVVGVLVCVALGIAAVSAGYVRFAGRDL